MGSGFGGLCEHAAWKRSATAPLCQPDSEQSCILTCLGGSRSARTTHRAVGTRAEICCWRRELTASVRVQNPLHHRLPCQPAVVMHSWSCSGNCSTTLRGGNLRSVIESWINQTGSVLRLWKGESIKFGAISLCREATQCRHRKGLGRRRCAMGAWHRVPHPTVPMTELGMECAAGRCRMDRTLPACNQTSIQRLSTRPDLLCHHHPVVYLARKPSDRLLGKLSPPRPTFQQRPREGNALKLAMQAMMQTSMEMASFILVFFRPRYFAGAPSCSLYNGALD
mmetsp:Transcript_73183/g.214512  ORF Transcript_73183/g.214512 Transcript_73183/m.214512 type:complete len:281 (+) Transcript_73183:1110-1952(+)